MIDHKRVCCVIPARLRSTRFPKKMLSSISGKPMLQWVWERANSVLLFDQVVFAIDSTEVGEVIDRFSGRYLMTSEDCASGTDRLVELWKSKRVTADIWVNWQGDEPLIREEMIKELLQTVGSDGADIWTLKKKIIDLREAGDPNIAKVVCDHRGRALYFSRSQIPYYRDVIDSDQKKIYKHVGLYAYSEGALAQLSQLQPCAIEKAEQLEQLRFLFHRLKIQVHETDHEVIGVDLPEHLTKVEKRLSQKE